MLEASLCQSMNIYVNRQKFILYGGEKIMGKIIVLNQKVVEEVLDMAQVVEAVEQVYISKSAGNATVWPMVFYEFEKGKADMDIKSGFL